MATKKQSHNSIGDYSKNDPLRIEAKKVIKANNFKESRLLYQAGYYATGKLRNLIYSGEYRHKPAVLKIFSDPRFTDEPLALKSFHQHNKSRWLTAPKLYKYRCRSNNSGWFIMEKLPPAAKAFKSPLAAEQRKEFLRIFLEYRRQFPARPHRTLQLAEQLPADQYHAFRISRWLQLTSDYDTKRRMNGLNPILAMREVQPRLKRGLALIQKTFARRPMRWCHGHFKPKELFRCPDGKVYLTDFAHSKMYPEGYELAFMIWADWILPATWSLPYARWKAGILLWLNDLLPLGVQLKIKNFPALMRASLVERLLGTILADVGAVNRPLREQRARLRHLYRLLDELLRQNSTLF